MSPRSLLVCFCFVLATSWAQAQQRVWTVERGTQSGVVWNLLLEPTGTVRVEEKIGHVSSGIVTVPGVLESRDFGRAAGALGDWNQDGVPDLVVGRSPSNPLYILCLNSDGTLQSHLPISPIPPALPSSGYGASVCALGDLDQNGVVDLAVGTPGVHAVRNYSGAVTLTFLNADGTTKGFIVITEGNAGFTGFLHPYDFFGTSVHPAGDLDGDSVPDLIVGATGGGYRHGTIWFLYLDPKKVIKGYTRTQASHPAFGGQASSSDYFGSAICMLDDLDGDGVRDIAVGAPFADEATETDSGAVWILFMNADESVKAARKIGATSVPVDAGDEFGWSLTAIDDLDGDGIRELAVGAPLDDETLQPRGAVWILHLNGDGSVRSHRKINARQGGFGGFLRNGGIFGSSLAAPGDLDGDGVVDLTAGALDPDDGSAGFGNLPEAVEDVAPGDTLLVEEGIYKSFRIDGKSLTIQADSGAAVDVYHGTVPSSVENLGDSDAVFLRGLRFTASSNADPEVHLVDNAGLVWIEDCRLEMTCSTALYVEDSSEVALLNTTASLHPLYRCVSAPEPVVSVVRSTVHAFDCSFLGPSPEGDCRTPSPGAAGIDVDSGFLYLSNCSVSGGGGSAACCTAGGVGLDLDGEAWIFASSIAGGAHGCTGQRASRFLLAPSASLNKVSGRALSMTSSGPIRAGETLELSFQGPPHVPVWIGSSLTPTASFRAAPAATQLVRSPLILRFAGITDATGALGAQVLLPPLPGPWASRSTFLQPAYPLLHGQTRQRGSKLAYLAPARWILGTGSMVVQLPGNL